MKILITGHRGYIGSHLYKKLDDGINVVHGIDLKDCQDIIYNLPDCSYDVVFHMAALPSVGYSVENPSYTLRQNVYATSVLLEWAKNRNVKRVVFSSSAAVYGNGSHPTSPYGLHKLMSEKECRLYSDIYKLDTVCLRYFNVYSQDQKYGGSYSSVISAWLEMLKKGQPLTIYGDGTQTRDFIHVEDVVDANIFCMNYDQPFKGRHLDVGSGKIFSLNDIKRLILMNNSVKFMNAKKRKGDIDHSFMSDVRLDQLGWQPKHNFVDDIASYFKEKNNE